MNRTLAIIGLATLAVFGLALFFFPVLSPLENRLLDRFVRKQAAVLVPDPDIVLVDIDEKSLANMEQDAGRWPWPRVVHASLVEGLAAQNPRAIVFDIAFVEADSLRPRDDAEFAKAIAQHKNTYFPLLRLPLKREADGIRLADFAPYLGLFKQPGADPDARTGLLPPLILPREQWRAGLISFSEDPDG